MEIRFILFLILSFLILTVSAYLVGPLTSRPPVQPPPTTAAAPPVAEKPAPPPPPIPPARPAVEREVAVKTGLYRATVSTRGGVLTRWELTRYLEKSPEKNGKTANVRLIEVPPPGVNAPLPLTVAPPPDQPRTEGVRSGTYELDGDTLDLTRDRPEGTLVLTYRDGPIVVVKRLKFRHDTYMVEVSIETRGLPAYTLYGGTNFGITNWGDRTFVGYVGPMSRVNEAIIQDKPKSLDQPAVHRGVIGWTALQDKYYLAALMPGEPAGEVVAERFGERLVSVGLREGSEGVRTFRLYAGPKEFDRLKAFRNGLDETIDFGWFVFGSWALVRFLAKPLFVVLNFFAEWIGNFGVGIILLTILIKTLFVPLTHKSYVSMKRMQAIQPQMVALQKKYKEDRQRLNRELMELYRVHRVNPLGGCLPMFLQVPVFVALFNILYTTIELRNAPFFLWIKDLSDKDPWYVLPIIMGATMVIQQRIQPTAMDPRQARLLMFLPVIFTFFFMNFPSGLVLYWLVNNLMTILQQYVTIWYLAPMTPTPQAPRAKRVKQVEDKKK